MPGSLVLVGGVANDRRHGVKEEGLYRPLRCSGGSWLATAEDEGSEQVRSAGVYRKMVLGVESSDQMLVGELTIGEDL